MMMASSCAVPRVRMLYYPSANRKAFYKRAAPNFLYVLAVPRGAAAAVSLGKQSPVSLCAQCFCWSTSRSAGGLADMEEKVDDLISCLGRHAQCTGTELEC